jgi:hypothetical protein
VVGKSPPPLLLSPARRVSMREGPAQPPLMPLPHVTTLSLSLSPPNTRDEQSHRSDQPQEHRRLGALAPESSHHPTCLLTRGHSNAEVRALQRAYSRNTLHGWQDPADRVDDDNDGEDEGNAFFKWHRRHGAPVVGRLVMYRTKVLLYRTMVLMARLTKVRR